MDISGLKEAAVHVVLTQPLQRQSLIKKRMKWSKPQNEIKTNYYTMKIFLHLNFIENNIILKNYKKTSQMK
jgi:hypothetical protein